MWTVQCPEGNIGSYGDQKFKSKTGGNHIFSHAFGKKEKKQDMHFNRPEAFSNNFIYIDKRYKFSARASLLMKGAFRLFKR